MKVALVLCGRGSLPCVKKEEKGTPGEKKLKFGFERYAQRRAKKKGSKLDRASKIFLIYQSSQGRGVTGLRAGKRGVPLLLELPTTLSTAISDAD